MLFQNDSSSEIEHHKRKSMNTRNETAKGKKVIGMSPE
jgi:hypothetical protein